MQEHFPIIRSNYLPAVVKSNNENKSFKEHINYVTVPIAYTSRKRRIDQEKANRAIHEYYSKATKIINRFKEKINAIY